VGLFPSAEGTDNQAELLTTWAHLFGYRDQVLAKLEEARIAKVIGSSLEARVEISAGSHAFGNLPTIAMICDTSSSSPKCRWPLLMRSSVQTN
jgi:hypothetical protein